MQKCKFLLALAVVSGIFTSGCTTFDRSVVNWAEVMNDRGIASCAKWEAYLKARDVVGGKVQAITISNGVKMDTCIELWKAQVF